MTAEQKAQDDRARSQPAEREAQGRSGRGAESGRARRNTGASGDGKRDRSGDDSSRSDSGSRRLSMMDAARAVVPEFEALTGLVADGISGARSEDDGWSFLIDVTELERIPASSSVMATYRVDGDGEGHLVQYERLRRFHRSATDPA